MSKFEKYMEQYINKEIFIVSCGKVPFLLFIFDDYEQASTYIELNHTTYGNLLKVHHGILSCPHILPVNIRNQEVYIVLIEPTGEEVTGAVLCTDKGNIYNVTNLIEHISAYGYHNGNDHIHCNKDMSNMFILYGYEVGTKVILDYDELDEESIYSCRKIVENANHISKGVSNV